MKNLLAGIIFVFSFSSFGQITLTDQSKVSIVIQGPYQKEVYSAFGHIGFRINDPGRKIDWFFNYGVYDFDQENFFLNFARGLLKYKVAYYDFHYFQKASVRENRYVKELELNLNLDEREKFLNYLYINAQPENAEYLYHYVFDNCATKIRDVTNEIFPGKVAYDYSYVKEEKTIRGLMDEYLEFQPWGDLGIDLGLGMQIDRKATADEYMFLPEYVALAFKGATIERNGSKELLVKATRDLFIPDNAPYSNGFLTPFNLFVILFFVVGLITNSNYKTGKRTKWVDFFLFGLAGFAGLWILYLWFGTEHLSKWNLNILWAIPIHLPVLFLMGRQSLRHILSLYFRFFGWWYLALLVAWGVLPQPLPTAMVPFVLTMVLRSFYIGYDLRKAIKY